MDRNFNVVLDSVYTNPRTNKIAQVQWFAENPEKPNIKLYFLTIQKGYAESLDIEGVSQQSIKNWVKNNLTTYDKTLISSTFFTTERQINADNATTLPKLTLSDIPEI